MSAKEMFIDLNFKQIANNIRDIIYADIDNPDFYVQFDLQYKVVIVYQTYDYNFDMKMLKAINKQVEELGWNER